jgi:hypothetical protein
MIQNPSDCKNAEKQQNEQYQGNDNQNLRAGCSGPGKARHSEQAGDCRDREEYKNPFEHFEIPQFLSLVQTTRERPIGSARNPKNVDRSFGNRPPPCQAP